MPEQTDTRPLAGITVVDVTRALAGPFCTMLLGDQGADVIKIERPKVGDETRRQSNPKVGDENTAFLAVNRNKRSITLDLRSTEGRRIAQALVSRADVFVENFRPGKAEQLGLGYEELAAHNPGLVYCSLSGWGSDGPMASSGGYAGTAEAVSGLMSLTGPADGDPVKLGVSIIDNLTGLYAKDAITAALLARRHSGVGQKVETSLLESAVSVLSMTGMAWLEGGVVGRRLGSEHEWNVPWRAFRTSDGNIMVTCNSDGQWAQLCKAVDLAELADDPRFATMQARGDNRGELYRLLEDHIAQNSTAHHLARFHEHGVAVAPIHTVDQVFADEQVLQRRMVEQVEHETLGPIKQIGHAQKFLSTPSRMALAPPTLGRHTDEILSEIVGHTGDEIAELRRDGVV